MLGHVESRRRTIKRPRLSLETNSFSVIIIITTIIWPLQNRLCLSFDDST